MRPERTDMATKEMKVCDVTGTTKGVESYRIKVKKIPEIDCGNENETVLSATVDLCPKAFDRLCVFILRGCTPPPPRKTKGDETAEAPADPPFDGEPIE